MAEDQEACFPPLLPWYDTRYQVPDELQYAVPNAGNPDSESRDDWVPSPASYARDLLGCRSETAIRRLYRAHASHSSNRG
uniref:Uncharacterized protein n=1 Tax=Ralstonia solanacearum TaxID=305 RepID=A0A0S4U6X0_RALSL|nr:protein of unknown function [Ralstonia solanacearum]